MSFKGKQSLMESIIRELWASAEAAIEEWIERCKSKGQPIISPKTQAPMAEVMIPNQAIKTQVIEWKEARLKAWKERRRQQQR